MGTSTEPAGSVELALLTMTKQEWAALHTPFPTFPSTTGIVNNASSTDPAGSVLVPITFAR